MPGHSLTAAPDLEDVSVIQGKSDRRARGDIDILKALRRYSEKVRVGAPSECWPFTGRLRDGYGCIRLHGHNYVASRLTFFLFNGHWPTPMCLHKCKQSRSCCNPAHLYEGDHKKNAQDRDVDGTTARGERHGRRTKPEATPPEKYPRGERHGMSKLTWAQVEWIRVCHASGGVTQKWLAEVLGVSRTTICQVISQEIWKDK